MALGRMLGFSLKPVRIDPDGASTPPDPSPIAPPSLPVAPAPRLLEKTRIEGLAAPPAELPGRPQPWAQPELAAPAAPAPGVPAAPVRAATSPPAEPPSAAAPLARAIEVAAPAWSSLRRISERGRDLARSLGRHGTHTLIFLALLSALVGFGSAVVWSRVLSSVAQQSGATEHGAAGARPAAASNPDLWSDPRQPSHSTCSRQREPGRIASDVSAGFTLEAHALPGDVDVLVGAAASNGAALGLRLNATTLQPSELLRESGARELLGVVPEPSASAPAFAVDRAVIGGYREWRTLPGHGAFALARTNAGLTLVRRSDQRSVPLWPVRADEELSRARIEWLDSDRLVLALRRGGRAGAVAVAWLNLHDMQRSALRDLPLTGSEIGLPSLAVQQGRAAIAAAVRMTASHAWRIQVATSEWQGATTRVSLPELSPRPNEDTFAPSIAALGDSRWVLQWTEGQQGERRVRALTLDAAFNALGPAITVSEKEMSAGGGVLVPVDAGLLSLFLVQRPGGYELWAAPLACH